MSLLVRGHGYTVPHAVIPTYLLVSDDKLESWYSVEDDDRDHVPVEVVVVFLGVYALLSLTYLQLRDVKIYLKSIENRYVLIYVQCSPQEKIKA